MSENLEITKNERTKKKKRRKFGKMKYKKSYIRGLLFSMCYAFVKTFYRKNIQRVCFFLLALVIVVGVFIALPYINVIPEITVEAGEQAPMLTDFLRWGNKNASFVTDLSQAVDMSKVGEYPITLHVYDRDVSTKLIVKDTVAPKVKTQEVSVFSGEEVNVEDFIIEISDVTETTASFSQEVDTVTEGEHEVSIQVQDMGGNITNEKASLIVCIDKEPPVIEGVTNLSVPQGSGISYKKGVTVTDNLDEKVKLEIDNSQVNLDVAGTYEVIYTATDAAGNSTSVTATVTVERPTIDNVTQESVNQVADEILASITSDDMTLYQKAEKIYWWCHENIAYADGTPKENPVKGAYRGLVNRKGDCYTYAMTAKILLTQAGITNMDIERIPSETTRHYWNIIDIGEGWYHFDTCRRKDGTTFFYKTDSEIQAYSDAHHGSHNYDRSLYPTIN